MTVASRGSGLQSLAESQPTTPSVYQADPLRAQDCQRVIRASSEAVGKPARKELIDFLNVITVLLTIACLAAGIVIINPRFPYDVSSGKNNQTIALSFLVGVMSLRL